MEPEASSGDFGAVPSMGAGELMNMCADVLMHRLAAATRAALLLNMAGMFDMIKVGDGNTISMR